MENQENKINDMNQINENNEITNFTVEENNENENSNNISNMTNTTLNYSFDEEQFTIIENKLNSIDSTNIVMMDFMMILSALLLSILVYLFLHFMLERRKM